MSHSFKWNILIWLMLLVFFMTAQIHSMFHLFSTLKRISKYIIQKNSHCGKKHLTYTHTLSSPTCVCLCSHQRFPALHDWLPAVLPCFGLQERHQRLSRTAFSWRVQGEEALANQSSHHTRSKDGEQSKACGAALQTPVCRLLLAAILLIPDWPPRHVLRTFFPLQRPPRRRGSANSRVKYNH